MHQWQEIKIAESELSDLMDELSPVVDVGASIVHAPGAKCRHLGWVAEWVLDGVLGELDFEFDSASYVQFVYRNPGVYSVPVVLAHEANFEYVPQRRKYVRKAGTGHDD